MKSHKKILKLFGSERGASMLEYALISALIAVSCIVATTALGNEAKKPFETTQKTMAEAACGIDGCSGKAAR